MRKLKQFFEKFRKSSPKKLGLALGGGGAKGFAHLGVLKTFKEEGISFDIITGTSIGALVGAVYAGGDLEAFEKSACNISKFNVPILLSPTFSIGGIFSGKNAVKMLENHIVQDQIEELDCAYAAVSVDLNSYKPVIFDQGSLKKAVRASMSIPMVFKPVVDQEKLLVDGGVLDPLPVKLARDMGADYVIAVDLYGTQYSQPVKPNMLKILEASMEVGFSQLTQLKLKESPPDVLISPDVATISPLDFHRGEEIIKLGEEATVSFLPEIEQVLK